MLKMVDFQEPHIQWCANNVSFARWPISAS